MDKYIGFDIDSKNTIACVVQKGHKDIYATLKTDIQQMKDFLQSQQTPGQRLHLTFEISGEAGYRYDALADSADTITVSNPTKMTWVYKTAKKTDRIDARKPASRRVDWRGSYGAHPQKGGSPVESNDSASQEDCQQGHPG